MAILAQSSASFTRAVSARQTFGVALPTVDPWTNLPEEYLAEVIVARTRHLNLATLGPFELESWVRARWPNPLLHLPRGIHPAFMGQEQRLLRVDYARVVHNRPDASLRRVAGMIRPLLTDLNVDEFARVELVNTSHPSWRQAVQVAGTAAAVVDAHWMVVAGNHRLIAQHLLGIGPFAFCEVGEIRWASGRGRP